MENENEFITFPTWKKYIVMSCFVERLKVKDKRFIFYAMRQNMNELSHDYFMPQYGMTVGEFSVFHILAETRRPRKEEFKNRKARSNPVEDDDMDQKHESD